MGEPIQPDGKSRHDKTPKTSKMVEFLASLAMVGLASHCQALSLDCFTYSFVDEKLDFASAQAHCNKMFPGGSVATFRNAKERQQFLQLLADTGRGKDVWVGATRASDDNNRFFWVGNGRSRATTKDQEIYPYSQPDLGNLWYTNEPNNNNGNEQCAINLVGLGNTLNDVSCNEKFRFVCEYRCAPSYYYIKEQVYQDDAERYCKNNYNNGALATMRTTKEVEDFEALRREKNGPLSWVGLQKDSTTGKFYWGSSGIQVPDHHATWASGEPNNAGGRGENCVNTNSGTEAKFNDYECSGAKKLSFFCESRFYGWW